MQIVKIQAEADGSHLFESQSHRKEVWIAGYAYVPETIQIPNTFPFVDIEVDEVTYYKEVQTVNEDGAPVTEQEPYTMMTVTSMTAGIVPERVPTAEERIASLKSELDATDYKIIKCSEYQLAGLELPYDVAALHAERQKIRDQINALEAETDK